MTLNFSTEESNNQKCEQNSDNNEEPLSKKLKALLAIEKPYMVEGP